MNNNTIKYRWIVSFLSLVNIVTAQEPGVIRGSSDTHNQASVDSTQSEVASYIDTAGIYYFYASEPFEVKAFSDTLLDYRFGQYDPVRKSNIEGIHLGHVGSAQQNALYKPLQRRGLSVGFHAYDIYKKNRYSIPYYYINKPITETEYNQAGEQNNGLLSVKFARNFDNGLLLNLDFERQNYLGTNTLYPNQQLRNTMISVGLWKKTKDKKYQAFLNFSANTFEHQDNGGIYSEPIRNNATITGPATASVVLSSAENRQSDRAYSLIHFYQLNDPKKGDNRFLLQHEFKYQRDKYKFFSDYSIADDTFYTWFPDYLTDDRGMRSYMEHFSTENEFKVIFTQVDKNKSTPQSTVSNLLEAGIMHTHHKIQLEPNGAEIYHDLFLKGRWKSRFAKRFIIDTYAHLGLANQAGDYEIRSQLKVELGKAGIFEGRFMNRLYSQQYIEKNYALTSVYLWNNDFKRTLETQLGASYSIPGIHFDVSANYYLISNFIYFDKLAIPQQSDALLNILQLTATKNFKLGSFGLDNTIGIQNISEPILSLPALFGKHSLYYSGRWFKVLDVKVGVDLRYTDTYYAPYYQPTIGQFIIQDRQENEIYPNLDAWFNMRVSSFRFFLRYENITNLIITDRLYYTTAYYPYPYDGFRFGIKWKLTN